MSEDEEIKLIFIEEVKDFIQKILDALDGFLTSSDSSDRLNAIFRGIHTIKGGAASCGFIALKEEAHKLETDLQSIKGHPQLVTESHLGTMRRALSRFENLLMNPVPQQEAPGLNSDPGFGLFDDSPTTPPQLTPASAAVAKSSANVIRVPLDRIQKNLDAIGEIFLTRNQLRHLMEQRMSATVSDEVFFRRWDMLDGRLRQNIRDLEQNALAMRLMSVKSLLRRMQSTIQDFAEASGKRIIVDLSGGDTELDKLIVDSLADPLIHLVRNAMDHGIESPDERIKSRKNASATIGLKVSIQGNEAVIQVSDDGRGIDPAKVLESAKRKGLDVSLAKTRDDTLGLIFLPGFSTKEVVSDVSGRGVGMDAVKTYVDDFGGNISIHTEVNVGTTFSLHLPLGLSVVPAVIAIVNDQRIALSVCDIVEIFKALRKDIISDDSGRYFKLRGQFIPCFNLRSHIFCQPGKRHVDQTDIVPICIINTQYGLVAIQVDTLQSNVEIALKSVPPRAAKLPYISGVATLATGDAVFVLSLIKLHEHIRSHKSDVNLERKEHYEAA